VSLKTAADKQVTDIQELPDNENLEYYIFLSNVLDVEPYNTVQTHIEKIAIAYYHIGKITFNNNCKGFEKVYELLADVIIK
jgi:hypothetical protein